MSWRLGRSDSRPDALGSGGRYEFRYAASGFQLWIPRLTRTVTVALALLAAAAASAEGDERVVEVKYNGAGDEGEARGDSGVRDMEGVSDSTQRRIREGDANENENVEDALENGDNGWDLWFAMRTLSSEKDALAKFEELETLVTTTTKEGKAGGAVPIHLVGHDRQIADAMDRGWWQLAQRIVEDANSKGVDVSSTVRSKGLAVKKNVDEIIRSLDKKAPTLQKISPALQWAQSEDSVFLNIKFAFRWSSPGALEVENEEIRSSDCCLHFHGQGKNSFAGRLYELDLELFGDIVPQETDWSFGSVGKLAVTLKKKEGGHWERLIKSTDKVSNIHTWWDMKERLDNQAKERQNEAQKVREEEEKEAEKKEKNLKKEANELRDKLAAQKKKAAASEAQDTLKNAARDRVLPPKNNTEHGKSIVSWLKEKAFGASGAVPVEVDNKVDVADDATKEAKMKGSGNDQSATKADGDNGSTVDDPKENAAGDVAGDDLHKDRGHDYDDDEISAEGENSDGSLDSDVEDLLSTASTARDNMIDSDADIGGEAKKLQRATTTTTSKKVDERRDEF